MHFNVKSLRFSLVVIILCGAVFLAYGNALFNQFTWDDGYLIIDNPYIKSFQFFPHLFKGDVKSSTVISHESSSYYRPLSMFSFMVDYKLWRLNPMGWHFVNILIHLCNCLLVFLIVNQICKNKDISLITSILFALHPVHVEAVTPIFNRMGIQATFFIFSGFLFFIKSENIKKWQLLSGSILMFILALLSKESAFVFPVLLLCYDYFYWTDYKFKKLFNRNRLVFYFACLFVCVVYLGIRKITISSPLVLPFFGPDQAVRHALAPNFFLHVLTVIKVMAGYVIKTVFPVRLSAIYWVDPVLKIFDLKFLGSLILVVAVIAAAVLLRRKFKDISFFILFFFISLLPVSNIIPISDSYKFRERLLYLPSLAVCYIMARLIYHGLEKCRTKENWSNIAQISFFAFLLSLCAFTAVSNYTWRSNLSLWKKTVKTAPRSQMAHLNLGTAYMDIGRTEEALAMLKKSLVVAPVKALSTAYIAKLNMIRIYTETGRHTEALAEVKDALVVAKQGGQNPFALYDKLGHIYIALNDRKNAEQSFKESLKYNKYFIAVRYNLGLLYYENGDYEKAAEQLKFAFKLDRDFIYAGYALGLTYVAQNKREEAAAAFRAVLSINPNFAEAQNQLYALEQGKHDISR